MKKVMWIVIAILVIVIVTPFLLGNAEKDELNEQTREQLDSEFIGLSDGVTHYELKGAQGGKTIVLVHGNAAPCFTWDNTIDALVDAGFRVLRYDVFGHGFSDRPVFKAYNRDLYDRQLVELLDRLSVTDPVFMVGTSQGGAISAYFTAKHPGRVEKLALLAPFFDSFTGQGMVKLIKTPGIGEYMMRLMGDKSITDPSKVLFSDEKKAGLVTKLKDQLRFKGKKMAVIANMRGNALDDATQFYREVKNQGIPVLLTWGTHDQSISGESMERLRKLIPTIEYHEFENFSHLAHYEFPEKINPILVSFFKK